MRIEFEIDEAEIKRYVTKRVSDYIATSIIKDRYEERVFVDAIKQAAKKAVEANMERLERCAIAYAGDKIAKNCQRCPLAKGATERPGND